MIILECIMLNINIPDEPDGRKDFVRNDPIRITFSPSSSYVEQSVAIPLVNDDINEAEEGFILLIEIEDPGNTESTSDDIMLARDGVALIEVTDEDRTF